MPEQSLDTRRDLEAEPIQPGSEELSPAGYLEVSLKDEERQALENWLEDHLSQITEQMSQVLVRFETERNQYEGKMPGADYPYVGAFRVNYPLTKKKAREVANRLKQAYLDSDPIWAVSTDNEQLTQYAEAVERGLDSAVRNQLDEEDDIAQAVFEATLHGAGFLVPGWLYTEGVKRDVETYRGFDGVRPETLLDLIKFEQRYPYWKDEPQARKLHAKIAAGKDVTSEVSYTVPLKNQPNVQHVPADRVRVYPECDGFEGLRTTPVYGFLKTYTRSQLEELARSGQIEQAQLNHLLNKEESEETSVDDEVETFDIFIGTATYQFPADKRPSRYKVWFEADDHVLLRIREFPFWNDEPDLIPLYIRQEEPGFFKRGLGWDLQDDHIVLNVLTNLYLNAIDMANSMRWIVKRNSVAEQHLLARRWGPHLPIPYEQDPNEIVANQQSLAHIPAIVTGFQMLKQQADDSTSTSSLQSGRESPTDPNAPATKTLLLLQQVEPNMKEYLRSLEPGFRQLGKWLIWLYYQGISLGWISELPGVPEMDKELLPEIAKALNPRALLFEFDRAARNEQNMQMLQLLSKLAPMAVPEALKLTIRQFNSQWARMADRLDLSQPMLPAPGAGNPAQPGSPTPPQPGANGNGMSRIAQQLGVPG